MLSPKQILARERTQSASIVDDKVSNDSPLKKATRSQSVKVVGSNDSGDDVPAASSSGTPATENVRKAAPTSYKSMKGSGYEGRQGILWKEVDPQASHNITETQQRVRRRTWSR
jgi:hypothetical protein